jgi:hypothetical protein
MPPNSNPLTEFKIFPAAATNGCGNVDKLWHNSCYYLLNITIDSIVVKNIEYFILHSTEKILSFVP